MNAALFVRVSKPSQDYERQVRELSDLAKKNQLNVVATFAEKISGRSQRDKRLALDELLSSIEKKNIQILLVTEVSRLGRRTRDILELIDNLHAKKVRIYIKNIGMYTLDERFKPVPFTSFIITILADLARLESEGLSERILSGLEHAKAKGKVFGRPPGSTENDKEILKKHSKVVRMLNDGLSIRNVAKVCEVSKGTVSKVKKIIASN